MARGGEETLDGRGFDHMSRMHDHDALAIFRGEREVVRDEDGAGMALSNHLPEEVHDNRLRRHVEPGRRLVRDEQLRPAGESHGDADALAHASRELIGVGAEAALRVGDSHVLERGERSAGDLGRGAAGMAGDHVGDLLADRADRVQRRAGVLEDD